ncbi:centromere protein P [Protopterus annectens]|uniref:centromere protein P n=1 Tax=Protopterus annectens TaxID=7888 RepID=UPI001CFABA37|nr:centromere protein P [Protopterus annectens]
MEEKSAAQVYEDEINSLKEEIRMLEEQYESKQQEVLLHTDKELLKKIEIYQAKLIGDFGGDCNAADLKAKLHEMDSEISLVTKLTGIEFTEYIKTFERTDDGKPIRKHRICGHCLSLPFQLEFKTVEDEVKDILATRILDLSIIMDCNEYASLSSFISRAEETKSLLLFFRTLSIFAEWCEHRRTTFRHFKVGHFISFN